MTHEPSPDAHSAAASPTLSIAPRSKWIIPSVCFVTVIIASVLYAQLPLSVFLDRAIIIPVAFIAAAVANATAVGGGFLFFPLFVYVYALAPATALKLSLATQAFGMTSGSIGWSWRFIDKRALVIGALGGLFGMLLGTLGLTLPSAAIKPVFGWCSLVIFAVILLEIKLGQSGQHHFRSDQTPIKLIGLIITGVAGGLITAWTAIGVGEFIALYLLLVYRVSFQVAIGTGVAVLAICSIAGLFLHGSIGGIPWEYLIFTAPGVIFGGYTGAWIGKNIHRWQRTKPNATGVAPAEQSSMTLKFIFSGVVLIDGLIILTHHYLLS